MGGVTVEIQDTGGNVVTDTNGNPLTTTTAPDGTYNFSTVPAGDYDIVEIDPANHVSTLDGDTSSDGDTNANANTNDNKIPVTLISGKNDIDNDFVDQPIGAVSGTVKDNVGVGLGGVTVEIQDAGGNVVTDTNGNPLTATTAPDGTYSFANVPIGDYDIVETDLANYISISDIDTTDDGDVNTNVNTNDNKIPVTVTTGENDANNDFVDHLPIAPTAVDDTEVNPNPATPANPTTLTTVSNDTDPENDINASSVNLTDPTATDTDGDGDNDSLVVPGEGTWTVDDASGDITFTPEAGFTADPTPITYNVKDNTGLTSNDATETVDYPQTAPVAVDDTQPGVVGTPTTVSILGNDSDPENDINTSSVDFDPASIPGSTGNDTDGDGDIDEVTVPGEGVWTVDDAGVVTFTPEAGFTADPTPLDYTVSDDTGKVSNVATITIDYTQTPDISITKIASVGGTGIVGDTINYELNVTNTGNVPLTNVTVTDVNATVVGGPIATLAVGASDTVTFIATHVITPADVAAGGVTNQAVATGTAPDGNITTDNSDDPTDGTNDDPDGDGDPDDPTVTPLTNPPVAVDDTQPGVVGTPTTVSILGNDSDPENDIDTSSVDFDPASIPGSTGNDTDGDGDIDEVTVPGEGVWTVDDAGVVTFTPEAGFTADPTPLDYTVSDDTGKVSNVATITIDYPNPVQASDDNKTGTPGDPVTQDVLANDSGDNPLDPTTVELDPTSVPGSTGTDTDNDGDIDEVVVPGEGTWTVDPATGAITFTPEAGFTGDPTPITYTVKDDEGTESDPATVGVDYPNPVQASDDNKTGTPGDPVTQDVLANDSGDNPLDPTTVELDPTSVPGSTGTDTDNDGDIDEVVVPGEGTWTVDPATGAITFTPEAGFTGDPTPIDYTVKDDEGTESDPATVVIDYEQVL